MKILLRIYRNQKLIKKTNPADRSKWRKLYSKLAWAQNKKGQFKYYIHVEYGYKINNWGKRCMFYNSGTYTNIHEAKEAFKAFIEL